VGVANAIGMAVKPAICKLLQAELRCARMRAWIEANLVLTPGMCLLFTDGLLEGALRIRNEIFVTGMVDKCARPSFEYCLSLSGAGACLFLYDDVPAARALR
jgi:hypothetical protein